MDIVGARVTKPIATTPKIMENLSQFYVLVKDNGKPTIIKITTYKKNIKFFVV